MLIFDKKYSAKPEMIFKCSPKLISILFDLVNKWNGKFDVLATSIIRPRTTDSGIHSYGRAVDFLLVLPDGSPLLSDKLIQETLEYVNDKYEYSPNSKLKTLIWHTVGGGFGSYHFHLQVKDDSFFRVIS